MKFNTILPLLLLGLLPCLLSAQQTINFGHSYQVYSEALQEDRLLNVLLPTEYADSTEKAYPVVYLLDGAVNEDFFHAAGLLRYLDDHGMMPPTILVGIANIDRKRDFTYPSQDPRDIRDFPTTGGSAKFIDFLQNELTTYVDTMFRATEHRTLVGQSLGGLLATEIVLKHPGTFNDYVIVSPSLWLDSTRLYQETQQLHDQLEVFPDRLFVSVGEEYPVMIDGSRRLAHAFRDGEETTEVTFLPLMDEDHNTILHEALYRAFDGWYDPTILRPYKFANAWNGLNIRSGPSLDSAVVGKLEYGQSLGVISAAEEEVSIDGLVGKWTYIGSDVGRGWVFDAYVSPVAPFTHNETIRQYSERNFDFNNHTSFESLYEGESWHGMRIATSAKGHQIINHDLWEIGAIELRLANMTIQQARMFVSSFLKAKGVKPSVQQRLLKQKAAVYWRLKGEDVTENGELTIHYSAYDKKLSFFLLDQEYDGG